ncbi:immunity protein Imm33 domain-containing protein [Neisseria musculi]|nr:DUF2185 domain-containing protein [Neisseria musculi]
MAFKTVGKGGAPVGLTYRKEPVFEQDSDRRFFSGDETDELTADSANFTVCGISSSTRSRPAVAERPAQPAGTAWKTGRNGKFHPAADWRPQD